MKRDRMLLKASLICFCFLAFSFLLMVPSGDHTESGWKSALAGSCFWLSLLTGMGSQAILTSHRRKWERKTGMQIQGRIGMLSFCKNPKGKMADLFLLISLTGFAVGVFLTHTQGWICYLFLGFLVLAFSFHCVYNGKNYNYLQMRKKLQSGRRARQRGILDEKQQSNN